MISLRLHIPTSNGRVCNLPGETGAWRAIIVSHGDGKGAELGFSQRVNTHKMKRKWQFRANARNPYAFWLKCREVADFGGLLTWLDTDLH